MATKLLKIDLSWSVKKTRTPRKCYLELKYARGMSFRNKLETKESIELQGLP